MQRTKIEYLDYTFNPIAMRCTPVSEGCANCWHLRMANRMAGNHLLKQEARHAYAGEGPWPNTEELSAPLRRKKPAIIGVQFMGDLFHKSIPNELIAAVFGVMAACPQHRFIVLTKRVKRAVEWFEWIEQCGRMVPVQTGVEIPEGASGEAAACVMSNTVDPFLKPIEPVAFCTGVKQPWPLPNVILMSSAENQKTLEERVRILLRIPASKRGVSLEPLLGPIHLDDMVFPIDGSEWHANALECDVDPEDDEEWKGATLDVVICGAETGPGKRPMELDWARNIRDQCQAAGTPFFFKRDSQGRRELDGHRWEEFPG
jgi:protein gp37